MTITDTAPAPPSTVAAKLASPAMFDPLRADLEQYLINRATEIEMFILALVSRSHLFMLGEPGTAKSHLTNLFQARVSGAVRFATLFSKDADSSLMFGPWSLAGLRDDKRVRAGKGRYLQHAHIAFFDEAWKANSALLNAMLTALNERMFDDDGIMVPIPLCTAILASNELPQQEHHELEAIYDRIEFRLVVEPLTDPADLHKLLTLPDAPGHPPALLDWADVVAAQHAADQVPVSTDTDDTLIDILVKLAGEGIVPSGRRVAKMKRIGQAAAWLAGAPVVEPGHLDFLAHTLWSDPKQRATVNKVVYEAVAPLRGEAIDLSDRVAGLTEDLDKALALDPADPDRNQLGSEIMAKLKRTAQDLIGLEARVGSGTKDADAVADTGRRLDVLASNVQSEVYGMPVAVSLVDMARDGKL